MKGIRWILFGERNKNSNRRGYFTYNYQTKAFKSNNFLIVFC